MLDADATQLILDQFRFSIPTNMLSKIGSNYRYEIADIFVDATTLPGDMIYICPIEIRWINATIQSGQIQYVGPVKVVIFKPFLIKYLLLAFPHINSTNIGKLFSPYPNKQHKSIFIMGYGPVASSPWDNHILCLHYDAPNSEFTESRLLIKLHLDKIQAYNEGVLAKKYGIG